MLLGEQSDERWLSPSCTMAKEAHKFLGRLALSDLQNADCYWSVTIR